MILFGGVGHCRTKSQIRIGSDFFSGSDNLLVVTAWPIMEVCLRHTSAYFPMARVAQLALAVRSARSRRCQ
jgi:hypothetical protein